MIKINLLAEAKRPAAVRRAKVPAGRKMRGEELSRWLLLGTLLLVVAACGVYGFLLWSEKQAKDREIAKANAEIKRLEPIIKEVEEYKTKVANLKRKRDVILNLKANQRGPVKVMDEISRSLPELLWLSRLEMNRNLVKITGRAFNQNAVASFIENLDRVPEFDEPLPGEIKQQGEVYTFALEVGFKPTVPPPEATPAGEPAAAGEPAGS